MEILNEFHYGRSPREAFRKFNRENNSKNVLEILAWYAYFDSRESGGEFREALNEYIKEDEEFKRSTLDSDLMEFFYELRVLIAEGGFVVTKLEINVKNGAPPSHVLIVVEYTVGRIVSRTGKKVVEIVHTADGVLILRSMSEKQRIGPSYSLYSMSVAACNQLIEVLNEKQVAVKILTLEIDNPDPVRPVDMPMDNFNFFGKLEKSFAAKTFALDQSDEPRINSTASLMKLAKHVQGLERLNLKYDTKLLNFKGVELLRSNFMQLFRGNNKIKCSVTIKIHPLNTTYLAHALKRMYANRECRVELFDDRLQIDKRSN